MRAKGRIISRLKKILDDKWSKVIKLRANFQCEWCGKRGISFKDFDAHHIYGKRSNTMRWNLDAGLCLCKLCHMKPHGKQGQRAVEDYWDWVKEYKGAAELERLRLESKRVKKFRLEDYEKLNLYLSQMLSRFGKYQSIPESHEKYIGGEA
jgi:transcription elongation factor Elf1